MHTAAFTVFFVAIEFADGHGYLKNPPGRSSIYRPPFNIPVPSINYDDNGLNCGGKYNMIAQGGKCGVCGDPYQGPYPHEAGGIYATGIIVKNYVEGQNITVDVMITADHRGWFEFRLCVNNDVTKRITHECLDRNLLREAGTGKTRLTFPPAWGVKRKILSLPEGVTCSQCVLQWKYVTGNSPGNVEEQFYACSDIAIKSRTGIQLFTRSIPQTTSSTSSIASTKTYSSTSVPTTTHIVPTTSPVPSTTHIVQTTTSEPTSNNTENKTCRCRRIGIPALNAWCKFQCKNFVCPSYLESICVCD